MEKRMGLPCYERCAYRRAIPGDSHSRCIFDWPRSGLPMPRNNNGAHTQQWFIFPFNFDPIWGPSECPAHAAQADPEKVAPDNPLAELLSLMGKRLM